MQITHTNSFQDSSICCSDISFNLLIIGESGLIWGIIIAGSAIDTGSKFGFQNFQWFCHVGKVRCASESKQIIIIVICHCYHCHLRFLLLFLPWSICFFTTTFWVAVSNSMTQPSTIITFFCGWFWRFLFCLQDLFCFPFFVCATRAVSTLLVHSSLMTLCWASSKMNEIRSSCFMPDVCPPANQLVLLAAVIVWRVGLYDAGRDNINIMLNLVSEIVNPIWMRLSQHCSIVWKWDLSSEKWVLESSLLSNFMLVNWSSVSSKYSVLLVVTSDFTFFHIASAIKMSFILAPSCTDIVNRMICWAKYSFFSYLIILASICQNGCSICNNIQLRCNCNSFHVSPETSWSLWIRGGMWNEFCWSNWEQWPVGGWQERRLKPGAQSKTSGVNFCEHDGR